MKKTKRDLMGQGAVRKSLEAKEHAMAAITTMRRFLDEAETELNRDSNTLSQKISQVMHQMAWGNANAQSDLQHALRAMDASNEYLLEMWKNEEEV